MERDLQGTRSDQSDTAGSLWRRLKTSFLLCFKLHIRSSTAVHEMSHLYWGMDL